MTERTWDRIDGAGTEFLIFDRSTDSLISGSAKGERSSQVVGITLPIISLVLAATGFFIFSRSNPSPEIRTASLLFLMAAIAFAVAPGSLRSNPWALHIQEFGVQLAAALFFVYFSLLRGKSSSAWSVSSAARWGIAAWGLGSAVLYSVSVTSWPEIFDGLALIRFGLVAAAFLGGLGYLVNSYLQSDSPVTREQLRIMAFGITVPILFFVTFTVLPGVIGEDEIVPAEISVLGLIFVPLSFAYAIMRHEFMGIRRLVHRGAAYALISLAIFIIYGASLGITRAAGGSDLGDNVTVQILLLVALFAAIPFITGSRRLAFAAVDRLLYKEVVDHPDLTRRISIDAAHARHVDDLASNVLGTIARELQLTFAAFVDVTDGRANVKASSGTMPAALVGTLSSQSTGVTGETALPSELAVPDTDSSAIAVALSKEERGAWVLCRGPKVTEEPFESADLALAQSVVGHIATMVEKLDLVEELKTKAVELRELNRRLVETQELERARIAGYLHDEPLQEITNLVWRYSDDGLPLSIQEDLQGIASGLRNFVANLHPGVLEDLGLVQALEWLGSESSNASDFEVTFQTESSNGSHRLDSEIELALYRIAQEALTNCQRHSKAKNVWISLSSNDSRATLVVEDDGVGLVSHRTAQTVAKLGLIGMRERAEQLGGYVRAASRSPSGTRVEASIPIDKEGPARLKARVLPHD